MDRRVFLRSGAALAAVGSGTLAGCASLFTTGSPYAPPLVQNRPDAVYVPSHEEGMKMAGMSGMGEMRATNGMNNSSGGSMDMNGSSGTEGMNDSSGMGGTNSSNAMGGMGAAKPGTLLCALTYSYPHRFWTTSGDDVKKVDITPDDTAHLMVSVWDAATGVYMMDTSPTVTFGKRGKEKTRNTPWIMLSENMGFHAGDNVSFSGDGTYSATVEIPAVTTRRFRGFDGEFEKPTSFEFTFEYSKKNLDSIPFRKLPNRKGKENAIDSMKMKAMPLANAPMASELPGRVLGQTKDDATFVVTAIEEAEEFGAKGKTYLAVSPRTPYNGYVLPSMGLSGRLIRDGKPVFDGALTAALDPELNYHYGATVESVESGDELQLTVDTPPQVARHEGYETAFFDMSPQPLTVE